MYLSVKKKTNPFTKTICEKKELVLILALTPQSCRKSAGLKLVYRHKISFVFHYTKHEVY